jgi:hypothetical protein
MIDPASGRVRHVVVGYGGLFGMGEDHYPMPFETLNFDKDKGGYVLNVDRDRINAEKAPSYAVDQQPRWDDKYEREVRLWYFPNQA